jgi:type VI secretion system protein
MAFDTRLMERLAQTDQYQGYSSTLNIDRLMRSVASHLSHLLNTRQGSAATVPDYGLPDFNDMITRFPVAITEIKREIKRTVEKYEPRLQRVRVTHVPDEDKPLSLRYEVTAQLMVQGKRSNIWFETVFDDSGKVQVMN